MTDATGSIKSLDRLCAQAVAALVPFLIDGPNGSLNAARAAAEAKLINHKPQTPKELQLATQFIAFSLTSDAYVRAWSEARRLLSVKAMMSLGDIALAWNAKCMKSSNALRARQRERRNNPQALTPEKLQWDEGAFQLGINQALDAFNDVDAKVAALMPPPEPKPVKTKLQILFAEPMTPALLARRARLH